MSGRTSTTQAIWRSYGGDSTKTAYAGSMLMAATFYLDPTVANTTAVQKSASDTAQVILPANAVVDFINVNGAGTGGSSPTFDLGWIGVADATALDVDGLVAEGDADAGKQSIHWGSATAGDDMGTTMSTTQMVRVTGGVGASAATGGAVSGVILYHVLDSGAQST